MKNEDVGTYGEEFGEKFQRHILEVALRIPSVIIRYRSALDHQFFASDVHRLIAKALFAHVDEYGTLPTEATLIEDIRPLTDDDTMEHVTTTLSKMYKANLRDEKAVVQKIVAFGKTQALINAAVMIAQNIDQGDRNALPVIQEAMLVGEDILDIGTDYMGTLDQRPDWYTRVEEERDIIPTGITHLDYALGGGLSRGELGVVLAPPKRGKTTTLINFGFGALVSLLDLNVVHYSMEIVEGTQHKVTKRYDTRLAGRYVKHRNIDPDKYAAIIQERAKKFVRGRLFVRSYPTRTVGITAIRNHLSLLRSQGFIPDLVIVDYADIMKAERRMTEMRHQQAGIYEDLRALAGEFDCAVWTASQASKASLEKEIITMADFAEAFEKAAIVDVSVAFCQTDDEKIDGKCRLVVIGARNEEDGRTVECIIRRDRAMIKSTALIDFANNEISPYGDEEDPVVETRVTTHTAENLKKAAGIKRPSKKKKQTPPFKKGKRKKSPKKPDKKLSLI